MGQRALVLGVHSVLRNFHAITCLDMRHKVRGTSNGVELTDEHMKG